MVTTVILSHRIWFSSPLGEFVFYIVKKSTKATDISKFSSPFGAFAFYMDNWEYKRIQGNLFSSPLGDFVFYILSLAVSINTELKTRFSAENIIEDIY